MLALGLGGCVESSEGGGDDAASDTSVSGDALSDTCEGWATLFLSEIDNILAKLPGCSEDSDCELMEPKLECDDGTFLAECPVAIPVGANSTMTTELARIKTDFCQKDISKCIGTPSCPSMKAICKDNKCHIHYDGP